MRITPVLANAITAMHVVADILEHHIATNHCVEVGIHPLEAEKHHLRMTNMLNAELTRYCALTPRMPCSEQLRTVLSGMEHATMEYVPYALLSPVRVGTHADVYQLPFVDLQVPNDTCAFTHIMHAIDHIPYPFAQLCVVASGNSFHLYGDRLVNAHDWHSFLGRALTWRYRDANNALQYLVDVAWVGHALARGVGTIRLTARLETNQYAARPVPTLVALIR
jgi:hypothetical protein